MLMPCNYCGSYQVTDLDGSVQECRACGETQPMPTVWYVNAYRVTLAYGGPEEGGWWYSIYEPLASMPCHTEADERHYRDMLENMFPNPDNKSSVAPGAHDIIVCVEEGVAEASPTERPFYE
jgi:hypothetical protein